MLLLVVIYRLFILGNREGYKQGYEIQNSQNDVENLVRLTQLIDDEVGQLVATKTSPSPSAECKAVNGAYLFHTELALQQRGERGESTSVTRIDNAKHENNHNDAASENKAKKHDENRREQKYLVDCLLVLCVIRESGIAETTCCIEECRKRTEVLLL